MLKKDKKKQELDTKKLNKLTEDLLKIVKKWDIELEDIKAVLLQTLNRHVVAELERLFDSHSTNTLELLLDEIDKLEKTSQGEGKKDEQTSKKEPLH